MDKRLAQEIIELVNEYLATYMSQYSKSSVALHNFEEECMSGYKGNQYVGHVTIRRLLHAIDAAISEKSQTSLTYPDGSTLLSASASGITFYDATGKSIMSLTANGITIHGKLNTDSLEFSNEMKNSIRDIVSSMEETEENIITQVEDLWQ